MRCVQCGNGILQTTEVDDSIEVEGHVFTTSISGKRCLSCGEDFLEPDVRNRFELHVAHHLANAGASSGPVLRFMRKALGMRAIDLAPLLDIAPEVLSRWETQKWPANQNAIVVLGALVTDRIKGRTVTLDRLRALREPKQLPKAIRIDVRTEPSRTQDLDVARSRMRRK